MIALLVLLLVTHWLADYTHLSTKWMLSAKANGRPLLPILAHATVHAVLALAALLVFVEASRALPLALFLLVSHFLIDVGKGRMNDWFPPLQSATNRCHWYVFGLDQLLHQLVIVAICAFAFCPCPL